MKNAILAGLSVLALSSVTLPALALDQPLSQPPAVSNKQAVDLQNDREYQQALEELNQMFERERQETMTIMNERMDRMQEEMVRVFTERYQELRKQRLNR